MTVETRSLRDPEEVLALLDRAIHSGKGALERFRKEVLDDLDNRLKTIADGVGEHGFDPYGMDPEALRRTAVGASFLYKLYFRCSSNGLENIPNGPVILAANHGGQLPFDAVMITTAMILDATPPRLARSMVDRWVPTLPFVSTFYSRNGVVLGSPENATRLLRLGEALLVFPEGMSGITKTVDAAYQLQRFGSGFVRLALATGAPIVPVSVVGSEEQYPTLYSLHGVGALFGLPALPIWIQMIVPLLGLLPLPVKYHLHFGQPLRFEGDPDEEDPAVAAMVEQVREEISAGIARLRAARRSVFW